MATAARPSWGGSNGQLEQEANQRDTRSLSPAEKGGRGSLSKDTGDVDSWDWTERFKQDKDEVCQTRRGYGDTAEKSGNLASL